MTDLPPNKDESIVRYGVAKRWSDLVAYRGVAYFVEVPDDPTASAQTQFHQVLSQVDERLKLVGSDRAKLLSAMIYLRTRVTCRCSIRFGMIGSLKATHRAGLVSTRRWLPLVTA
jgi:enamine deaminase RidA (YjgF/YER057c/UK114 family)